MGARDNASNIEITPRDIEVFVGLFVSRVMTLRHIADVHFDGHLPMAKKRIQKLKQAGFIGERPRRVQQPSILTLTRKGFELLTERQTLDAYPLFTWKRLEKRLDVSPMTLDHELEVMDFKAAIFAAVRKMANLSVAEFSTWPALHAFTAVHPEKGDGTVKPDGFFRLHESEGDAVYEHAFFVEVDRSTEKLEILTDKCERYRNYYRRGGFAVKHRQPPGAFKEFPFRVVILSLSEQRLANIAASLIALSHPIKRMVLLITHSRAVADPLGSDWRTAAGYNQGESYSRFI